MLPKCVTAVVLFLMLSTPAFGQDADAFLFPPSTTPGVVAPVPGGTDAAGLKDWTPEDWSEFLQNFVIPLVTLLVGLFGGGLGVRLRDRWAKNKEQKQADIAKTTRIMLMLSSLVPQLHSKVVSGDKEAKKRDAALAKAKEALDEA